MIPANQIMLIPQSGHPSQESHHKDRSRMQVSGEIAD
jgi:hypothetical protein